jgi:hypothetical protein
VQALTQALTMRPWCCKSSLAVTAAQWLWRTCSVAEPGACNWASGLLCLQQALCIVDLDLRRSQFFGVGDLFQALACQATSAGWNNRAAKTSLS